MPASRLFPQSYSAEGTYCARIQAVAINKLRNPYRDSKIKSILNGSLNLGRIFYGKGLGKSSLSFWLTLFRHWSLCAWFGEGVVFSALSLGPTTNFLWFTSSESGRRDHPPNLSLLPSPYNTRYVVKGLGRLTFPLFLLFFSDGESVLVVLHFEANRIRRHCTYLWP